MEDLIKFQANVVNVTVKAKKLKWTDESGDSHVETVRIGRLTLEFDGDGADVAALARLIHGKAIYIGLADAQMRMMAE